MIIRALKLEDADALWALRLEALESEPEAFGESAEEHRASPADRFPKMLASSDENFVMGAFAEGKLSGMMGFIRNTNLKGRHRGRVWGVYVSPSMRGHGAGKAMLTALIENARSQGVTNIMLTLNSRNEAAKALYKSLGFELFGTERDALRVGGVSCDEDYMLLRF